MKTSLRGAAKVDKRTTREHCEDVAPLGPPAVPPPAAADRPGRESAGGPKGTTTGVEEGIDEALAGAEARAWSAEAVAYLGGVLRYVASTGTPRGLVDQGRRRFGWGDREVDFVLAAASLVALSSGTRVRDVGNNRASAEELGRGASLSGAVRGEAAERPRGEAPGGACAGRRREGAPISAEARTCELPGLWSFLCAPSTGRCSRGRRRRGERCLKAKRRACRSAPLAVQLGFSWR